MAAIDRTNYKRIQRSYYNVNIYNDTNDVIECKYSANMIVPLLDKPNQYEVSVVRASVPLDGIPISQANIGFESWQVQFTNTTTGDKSNAYVQQFNPNIESYTDNVAITGINGQYLGNLIISSTEPSGLTDYSLAGSLSLPLIYQGLIYGGTVSNITYTHHYLAYLSSPTIVDCYNYGSTSPSVSYDVTVITGLPQISVRGMCSCQLNDDIYVLLYDIPSGSWSIMLLTNKL